MRKIKNIAQLIAKYNSYKITKEELREILKGEPFGRVTGIIGPYVLRYHKDKLIISDRAVIYNASQSEESVQGRKNFTAEIKFASVLNNIESLKKIWQQADLDGRYAYHRIIKYNKMKEGRPSRGNIITPGDYQIYKEQLCSLNDDLCIKVNENAELKANENLVIVIVPYDPVDEAEKHFEIISICCPSEDSEIKLSDEQADVFRRYKKYIMYSAVIRVNGNNVEWSNTVTEEGRINFIEKTAVIKILLFCLILSHSVRYTLLLGNKAMIVLFRDG